MTASGGFRRDSWWSTEAAASTGAAGTAGAYTDAVKLAIDELVDAVVGGTTNGKDINYAKGDAAEFWHAGTANVDAVRLGHQPNAWTPRDASVDDIVFGLARESPVQVKYYRTPGDTTKAISNPAYDGMDKVVPADQHQGVINEATRQNARNAEIRPEMADQYRHTAEHASDRIHHDGAQSRPLTEQESRELVQDARSDGELDRHRWGLEPAQVIGLEDIARQALHAGAQAAALSAALQLAPIVVAAIQQSIRDGELDHDELQRLARGVPAVALRSGISGSITAALVTATRSGMLGSGAQGLPPTAIAAAVVLSINCLQTSYRAAVGEITWQQASVNMVKDGLVLAGAMAGGVLGQAVIPVPLLGALIGNLVGATLARAAVSCTETLLLGLAIDQGWTVFGMVTQDYTLPGDVLVALGWDQLDVAPLQVEPLGFEPLAIEPLALEPITSNGVELRILRRGQVGIGRIGYI